MKIFSLFLMFLGTYMNAQTTNDTIKKMIKPIIEINLSKIPIGSERKFDFDSRNDFANCFVGEPIKVLTINSKNELIELNEWRVPISLNGNDKIFFTVKKIKSEYKVVDIGGVELAKEIQKINTNNNQKTLIRLFNLNIDFIAINYKNNSKKDLLIIPLQSAQSFLNSKNSFVDKKVLKFNDLIEINKIK